ncbi:MAG: alanine racemase [Planctomycetes bacterium]|nr:alanine racemase [Planctomycetota bacterium]
MLDQAFHPGRRAWARVDLAALDRNIRALRRFFGNRALLVPVKANAYGHGAVAVARAAVPAGAAFLGVADVSEGIELREAGIDAPILVLGAVLPEEIEPALRHSLEIVLSPADILDTVLSTARGLAATARVHLLVDTGMSRNGIDAGDALRAARVLAADDCAELVGLATHFAASEREDESLSQHQLDRFRRLIAAFRAEKLLPPFLHAANSAALLGLPRSHFNLVRPGLAVYGIHPAERFRRRVSLQPVLSVHARITLVRSVPAGTTVGYGATYRTSSATRLATVPVGYADGWPTSLSNRGHVLVRGQRVPIAGRISMDSMVIDVGHVPEVRAGETVTLLGRGGHSEISLEELADLSGRIPYEVLCGLGRRLYLQHSPGTPHGDSPGAFPCGLPVSEIRPQ